MERIQRRDAVFDLEWPCPRKSRTTVGTRAQTLRSQTSARVTTMSSLPAYPLLDCLATCRLRFRHTCWSCVPCRHTCFRVAVDLGDACILAFRELSCRCRFCLTHCWTECTNKDAGPWKRVVMTCTAAAAVKCVARTAAHARKGGRGAPRRRGACRCGRGTAHVWRGCARRWTRQVRGNVSGTEL